MTFDETKMTWFLIFTNAAFAHKSKESKKRPQTKRNSLIMFRLGSKSPYCTTWICSCTVWLRTLAMISISIAVCFALEFSFWYYVFLFRFYFVKGFYRLKSVCMSYNNPQPVTLRTRWSQQPVAHTTPSYLRHALFFILALHLSVHVLLRFVRLSIWTLIYEISYGRWRPSQNTQIKTDVFSASWDKTGFPPVNQS